MPSISLPAVERTIGYWLVRRLAGNNLAPGIWQRRH